MKKRSECRCFCHTSGGIHIVACCVPDEGYFDLTRHGTVTVTYEDEGFWDSVIMKTDLSVNKNREPIIADDFYYDLFQGYIEPETHLVPSDAEKVRAAIRLIEEYRYILERNELVEYS